MTFVSQFTQLSGICVLWIVRKYFLLFRHLFSPRNLRRRGIHPFKKEIYLVKKIEVTHKRVQSQSPSYHRGQGRQSSQRCTCHSQPCVSHTCVSPTYKVYHIHSPPVPFTPNTEFSELSISVGSHQTVIPSHRDKVNQAKHTKGQKKRHWACLGLASGSGLQAAGKGSHRCQHLSELLPRRPASPGLPQSQTNAPQQQDS